VLDGYSVETNMEVDEFLGGNVFKNDKKSNYDTQELYDIVDKIDTNISKTEDLFDHYDKEYCPDGNCITCKPPSISAIPEAAEIEYCGNEDGIIPLGEICKLKCEEGAIEDPDFTTVGVCSTSSPNPRNPLSYLNELFLGQYEGKFEPDPYIKCNRTCDPLTNEILQGMTDIVGSHYARTTEGCDQIGYSGSRCNPTCRTGIIGSPPVYECKDSGEWGPIEGNEPLKCEDPCRLPSPIQNKYGDSVDFENCINRDKDDLPGGRCEIQCKHNGNDNKYYPYNGDDIDQKYELMCDDLTIDSSPRAYYWNYPPNKRAETYSDILSGVTDHLINDVFHNEAEFYLCKQGCEDKPFSYTFNYRGRADTQYLECTEGEEQFRPNKKCKFKISSPNTEY